ncbi:thioesterase domain-containing protein [Ochromonadaceae sp. CCMP2298]|nr:thioesterase domain-containing protein [Ochromonadaceae sp. CCMP2298]
MITITKFNNPKEAKLNVFCFHWAGGNSSAFRPLAKVLEQKGMRVFGVNLPGRNGRDTDKMLRSISQIAEATLSEYLKLVGDLGGAPTAFFGHSLGGLVAFELTRLLEGAGHQVCKVVVSAVRCPAALTLENRDPCSVKHHLQSDAELMQYIDSIGGGT